MRSGILKSQLEVLRRCFLMGDAGVVSLSYFFNGIELLDLMLGVPLDNLVIIS